MNIVTESNAPDSAELSNDDPLPEPQISELDYLNQEISDARAALSKTVAGLKNSCAASVDAREWIKRYPWAAMGIATVAGFTVATVVTPPPGVAISEKSSDRASSYSHALRGRIAAMILGSLFDLTKLLLEGLIIAALRNPTVSQKQAAAQPESVDPPDCE
jgi:hypothetical protein